MGNGSSNYIRSQTLDTEAEFSAAAQNILDPCKLCVTSSAHCRKCCKQIHKMRTGCTTRKKGHLQLQCLLGAMSGTDLFVETRLGEDGGRLAF